jgi:hypothetical protein
MTHTKLDKCLSWDGDSDTEEHMASSHGSEMQCHSW